MQRFFDKVQKTETCWIWTAAIRGKSGYGCLKYRNKIIDAHRVSWMIHYGEIPKGLCVCHHCDNRKCVNPNHLFLGSHKDNMQDCSLKGRIVIPNGNKFKNGHFAFNSSITKQRADEIREKIVQRKGMTLKELSLKENISYQLIRDINCNRIYK